MPSRDSSSSSYSRASYYTSHSPSASRRASTYQTNYTTITSIPGRGIHPSKLGNLLQARFGNNYSVEMRADNYRVSAGSKISYDDIRNCY
ncbi:hypothetical protein F5Y09DRAFT_316061 [Xylaria sp. FL1042]|nr:hypothetical protein F5Y09DRAFT_316061 [Xylaria sp. FL1042]